jgi:glycosyltransferase involved in cell wall biosynthesis
MKVMVTLTALNEEANIGDVVLRIIQQGYGCILVDDGSVDRTCEIARSLGASVLKHPVNLGQGYAVLTSFKAAIRESCQVVIEMDADGQHDPMEIPLFLEKMEKTGADIVVGSRILGQNHPNAPFFRKTFLPYFTSIINRLTGYDMTDAMCGFRAFRRDSLAKVAPLLDSMLEPQYIAAEMFIRFARAGLRVEEVPIHLGDRSRGKSYKGLARYGFGVLKAISKTLLDKSYRRQTQL